MSVPGVEPSIGSSSGDAPHFSASRRPVGRFGSRRARATVPVSGKDRAPARIRPEPHPASDIRLKASPWVDSSSDWELCCRIFHGAGVANRGPGWFLWCMNRWTRFTVQWVVAMSLMTLLSGCETYGKADWKGRVGHYTWDQALEELGPPQSEARTSDGSRVADWLVSASRTYSTAVRGPLFWSWSGQDVTTTAESHLLLTFSPEGRLKAWKRIYK